MQIEWGTLTPSHGWAISLAIWNLRNRTNE